MGRRFADQAPVWPIAHAAGLQNQRDIWADAKLKRKMDRLVQARALGVEDALAEGNDEVPGDINIKGDESHQHHHYYAPTPAPAPAPTKTNESTAAASQPAKSGLSSLLLPALLGGALVGTGVGGAMLYNYATDKPDSVTTITQPSGQFEYRYGIEQRPTPK